MTTKLQLPARSRKLLGKQKSDTRIYLQSASRARKEDEGENGLITWTLPSSSQTEDLSHSTKAATL